MKFEPDILIFKPKDIDLDYSPLRKDIQVETYVLGAFNPGFTRLPDGNLLMMVRVAEALKEPVFNGNIHTIRWSVEGYKLDSYPLEDVNTDDPRSFLIKYDLPSPLLGLTSLSWLLPVELSADGLKIIKIHYDKIISPNRTSQEYGIENARISQIDGKYYMTTCTVSSERHATSLFSSDNGLNYSFKGIILDHPFIRPKKGNMKTDRIGGGTPPILTNQGWLMLYHAVETSEKIGKYRTYWALLNKDDPTEIIRIEDKTPLLEANPLLTENLAGSVYMDNVVFTTGIVDAGDHFIMASGEIDLACRITHISKKVFGIEG